MGPLSYCDSDPRWAEGVILLWSRQIWGINMIQANVESSEHTAAPTLYFWFNNRPGQKYCVLCAQERRALRWWQTASRRLCLPCLLEGQRHTSSPLHTVMARFQTNKHPWVKQIKSASKPNLHGSAHACTYTNSSFSSRALLVKKEMFEKGRQNLEWTLIAFKVD